MGDLKALNELKETIFGEIREIKRALSMEHVSDEELRDLERENRRIIGREMKAARHERTEESRLKDEHMEGLEEGMKEQLQGWRRIILARSRMQDIIHFDEHRDQQIKGYFMDLLKVYFQVINDIEDINSHPKDGARDKKDLERIKAGVIKAQEIKARIGNLNSQILSTLVNMIRSLKIAGKFSKREVGKFREVEAEVANNNIAEGRFA